MSSDNAAFDAIEQSLRQRFLAGLDGDSAAYRQFLGALSGHLRAFLRRRLLQWPDEVEDVLQETLLAVHNSRHTYRRDQPLTAWVHAIARYKLMDFLRSHGRRGHAVPLDAVEDLLGAVDDAPTLAQRDIGRLLEQLPERHRLPILHVKLQGLSVEETARLTGMSASAIKVGVHRGLKALAQKVRETP
ncbi:sigma-70 family RNA polymerase sigma factor [Stenotrophomonas maltophilia]